MTKSYSATLLVLTCAFLVIETTPMIAKEYSCPDEITTKAEKEGQTFEGDTLILKSAVYKHKENDLKCLYNPKGLQRTFALHAKLPSAEAKECKFKDAEKSKEKECTKPPCVLSCED